MAAARSPAELDARREIARQRLAFYCATPAYAGAFAVFGLEDLCSEMAQLSRAARWGEMARCTSDDLLNECVIVALYDELAATIKKRYGETIQRIEVSIAVTDDADREQLREIVSELQTDEPAKGAR